MKKTLLYLTAIGLLVFLMLTLLNIGNQESGRANAAPVPEGDIKNADVKGRDADVEAIRQASREFAAAFAKGDAKAAAAFWTAHGEYQEEGQEPLRGREAIEKAFAEFFKAKPKSKIEIRIESVRFPAAGMAIEEGLLRNIPAGKGLPSSSFYSTIHVREGDSWKIALSREWGAAHDRLEDLEWLLGGWKGGGNGTEMSLTFERDPAKKCIIGHFTRKAKGKVEASGTLRIALDPQRNQLRSWHFDDDGGHGQALWLRDGNRWVMDVIGVLADGVGSESVNVLIRTGIDTFTLQSIDRAVEGKLMPDTPPVKLTRIPPNK